MEQTFKAMDEKLKQLLEQLYFFLRDQGFSTQSEKIRKLIYCVEINDIKKFRKEFKSSMIWGGGGSIRDIGLRDREKQSKLDDYVRELKNLGSKV
jgi:hypothetical protein